MGRAPCCDKVNVKRGPWSPEEDQILRSYIEDHGTGGNWIALPRKAGLNRCGKSCRLRWLNYLRPNIKRGGFTEEEPISFAAFTFNSAVDNDVKNYWNTKLKKKLMPTYTVNQTPPPAVHFEVNSIGTDSIFAMSGKNKHRLYSPLSTSSSLMLEQRDARSKNNEQEGSAASSTVVTVDETSSSSSSSAMGHWSWPTGEDDMLLTEFDMGWISELLATPREI